MERPSHIDLIVPHAHPQARRTLLIAAAVSLQCVIVWGFATGLSVSTFHFAPPDLTVQFAPRIEPREAPPLPPLRRPEIPKAMEPIFKSAPPQENSGAITLPETAPKTAGDVAPPTGPSRAAVAIAATHTTPPYPPVELRLGREGVVTLRLTVLADGRVGRAEIVQSSGHAGLDQAAQQWIVAHWTYRPALDSGRPAASQALASVRFSLEDRR